MKLYVIEEIKTSAEDFSNVWSNVKVFDTKEDAETHFADIDTEFVGEHCSSFEGDTDFDDENHTDNSHQYWWNNWSCYRIVKLHEIAI